MTIKGGVYSRLDMIRALVAHFCQNGMLVSSHVNLGAFQTHVLVFNKSEGAFVALECLYGGQPNTLAAHFSKANSYLTAAKSGALEFKSPAQKRNRKTKSEWPNAARRKLGTQFSVSVALMEKTCKRLDLLRSLKAQFPAVGIVRVKMNGECREYIRDRNGNKDLALTVSAPVKIPADAKFFVAKK